MVETVEIKVPDIQPEGFPVEVVDEKNIPVAGAVFQVSVDGRSAITKETGADGVLNILRPQKEVSFSLQI